MIINSPFLYLARASAGAFAQFAHELRIILKDAVHLDAEVNR
jgi:hypothetical protein